MTAPDPEMLAAITAVNAAVSAFLAHDHDDALATLQAAFRAGLGEAVVVNLLVGFGNALQRLGEIQAVDPATAWSDYLQRRTAEGWRR